MADLESTKRYLKEANKALSIRASAYEQLTWIVDALHGLSGIAEEFSDVNAVDVNALLKKTLKDNKSFGLNTFTLRDPLPDTADLEEKEETLEDEFKRRVTKFVNYMTDHAHEFDGSMLFDDDGFKEDSSVVSTLFELTHLLAHTKNTMKALKKDFNRQDERSEITEKYSYIVRLVSSNKENDLSRWMKRLFDKPLFKQVYLEKRAKLERDGIDKELLNQKAKESLELEILKAYIQQVNKEHFSEEDRALIDEQKHILKTASLQGNDDLISTLNKALIHRLIQSDIDAGRQVFLVLSTNEKKQKAKQAIIAQSTSTVAFFAAFSSACIGAIAIASAMGFQGTGLFSFFASNPSALALSLLGFAVVLVTNIVLYDKLVKDLFSLIIKWRLFKETDGTTKSTLSIIMISLGLVVAIGTAAGMGFLSYSSCYAALSAVMGAGAAPNALVALSAVIGGMMFVTMIGFNFVFFREMLSNFDQYKRQLALMFKGRNMPGKVILGVFCGLLTALYALGSFMMNQSAMIRFFSPGAAYTFSFFTGIYAAVAGFGTNRGLIEKIRHFFIRARDFSKIERTAKQWCLLILWSLPKKLALQLVGLVGATVMVAFQMVARSLMVVINTVLLAFSPIYAIGVSFHSLRTGVSVKKYMGDYFGCFNKAMSGLMATAVAKWLASLCNTLLKMGGALAILLNAVAASMTRAVPMAQSSSSIVSSVPLVAGTTADSAALSVKMNTDTQNRALEEGDKEESMSHVAGLSAWNTVLKRREPDPEPDVDDRRQGNDQV